MEWGLELWDQFDGVDKHHHHQIEFVEKYAKFVKDRVAIESDYANKLRKLIKSNQPKKKDEDKNMFSTQKAFYSQLSELGDIAGQHEVVAEEMLLNITKVLVNFCNELKAEKKKIYQDGRSQQTSLDQQERSLEQTKKKFEKEWKECERLRLAFEKLDADINVTKIEVEKARHAWMAKKDVVESCKTDYGAALETFNKEQQDHYNEHMPKLFQAFKEADERRVVKTREMMTDFAKIDLKVKPLIQKCLEGMESAANSVNAEQDANLVVERMKSGFSPPPDKEFEDYTQPQQPQRSHSDSISDSSKNSTNTNKPANKKGGLSWMFGKKKVVESADYSHLPPEQRRKKLQKIINDFKKNIHKEEEERKAIMKMQEVYRANPALGNADSLADQIRISNGKLEKLQGELAQHEAWYAEAAGSVQPSSRTPSRPLSSYNEKTTEKAAEKPSPKPAESSFPEPPKDMLSDGVPPPPPLEDVSKEDNTPVEQTNGDEFDEEPEPIGSCVALYDFDANSEGALSMVAGEKFAVVEADSGDGWTRCMQGDKDGYVPTSYLDVTFFPS